MMVADKYIKIYQDSINLGKNNYNPDSASMQKGMPVILDRSAGDSPHGNQFCYSLLTGPGWTLFKRIANRGRIILIGDKTVRVNDVKDIVEATTTLTRYLRENGKRFSDFA